MNKQRSSSHLLLIVYVKGEMSKESEISGKEALEQACRGMDIIYFMWIFAHQFLVKQFDRFINPKISFQNSWYINNFYYFGKGTYLNKWDGWEVF